MKQGSQPTSFKSDNLTEAVTIHNRVLEQVKHKLRNTPGLTVSDMNAVLPLVDAMRRDIHEEVVAEIIKQHLMGGADELIIAGHRDTITYATALACAKDILERLTRMGLIRTNESV